MTKTEKYKTELLENITDISITQGVSVFQKKMESEKHFVESIIPKLPSIIKSMYGLDVIGINKEFSLDFRNIGYYIIRPDLYIKTKQEQDILIECKNPRHQKAELFAGISQIMSYQMAIEKAGVLKPKYILATSIHHFYLYEFLYYFNITSIDIIANNKDQIAFWNNDILKHRMT